MTAELWLEKRCPTCEGTGRAAEGAVWSKVRAAAPGMRVVVTGAKCSDCIDGSQRVRLDPDKVVLISWGNRTPITVKDVIDALENQERKEH